MYAPLKLVSTYLGTHFNRLTSALRHANFMVVRQQWARSGHSDNEKSVVIYKITYCRFILGINRCA